MDIGRLHHLLETFRCSRVRPNRHRGAKLPRGYLGKRAVINHSEGQALWADCGEHLGSNTPGGHTPLSCEQIEQGCSSPSPPHSVFRHQIHVLVFTFYVSPQVFQILLQGGVALFPRCPQIYLHAECGPSCPINCSVIAEGYLHRGVLKFVRQQQSTTELTNKTCS